ncbi:MAG: hypothetical protein WC542_09990 [Paludibacter sp.]
MEYTCENDSDNKILIIRLFGELYSNEVALMDKEIRLKAQILDYKIVYDFRETINDMSITDAYYWFVADYNKTLFELKHIPVALITNREDVHFFNFFETTSINKGARIKICEDEFSAFQWFERL